MRAISTVLDASLCLLLVSASAVTLAGTPVASDDSTSASPDTADRTAELLATSTASVTYVAENRTRTVHDTLAGLLASAVHADSRANSTFVRGVTTKINATLRRHTPADLGVQVVVHDRENSTGGELVAGATPPPETTVHAASFDVRGVRLTVRTWSA